MFTVKGGIVHGPDGNPVTQVPTRNKSGAIDPDLIVIHDTASGLDMSGPVNWLSGGGGANTNSSAHFVVGRLGELVQLAPTGIKTWHAGKSSYNGRRNVNGFSIGIEIVNPGWLTSPDGKTAFFSRGAPSWDIARYGIKQVTDEAHPGRYWWMPYTVQQIQTVTELCRALVAYHRRIKDIKPHWYISPGRKVDTNPLFPLERLYSDVFNNRGPVSVIEAAIESKVTPPATINKESDEHFEFDALTTTALNLRPFPDSPNRFGVININGRLDIIRQSVSQKDGSIWYLVAVEPKYINPEKGQLPDTNDGRFRGFVSSKFVKLVD